MLGLVSHNSLSYRDLHSLQLNTLLLSTVLNFYSSSYPSCGRAGIVDKRYVSLSVVEAVHSSRLQYPQHPLIPLQIQCCVMLGAVFVTSNSLAFVPTWKDYSITAMPAVDLYCVANGGPSSSIAITAGNNGAIYKTINGGEERCWGCHL